MPLLPRLTLSFRAAAAARPAPVGSRPPSRAVLPADDPHEERPQACGWYDSSHDLRSGLRVTEHAEASTVVHQIPLSWWLSWELDAALTSVR